MENYNVPNVKVNVGYKRIPVDGDLVRMYLLDEEMPVDSLCKSVIPEVTSHEEARVLKVLKGQKYPIAPISSAEILV